MLRRLFRERRAAVALIFGLSAVPVIALIGASVDYLQALRAQTHLQGAADAAALAAASLQNADATQRNAVAQGTFKANFSDGAYGLASEPSVTVDGDTVAVGAGGAISTSFLGIIGMNTIAISASAIATRAAGWPACMLTLNPDQPSVQLQGTPKLTAHECAVHANSSHSSALHSQGAASAVAEAFCAVGGHSGPGFSPQPLADCPRVGDPFANLSVPDDLECDSSKQTTFKKGTYVATQGVYCGGIDIQTHAEVAFEPGLYVIRDGKLTMNAHSTAIGDDVTFYFYGNGTGVDIKSHAEIEVSAPTDGDYAGLAFVQHPDSNPGHVNILNGGGGMRIVGLAYFPTQALDIGGMGSFGAASPYMGLIADSVILRGNAQLVLRRDHEAAGFGPMLPNVLGSVRLTH